MKGIAATLACMTPVLLAFAGLARSQDSARDYPAKPVSIVIGNGPGGPTDVETRLYAQKLSQSLGTPFVLDFKPGAGTAVGSAFVVRSAHDGYTLISATGGFTIPLRDQIFDPVRDFTAVSLMSRRPSAFYIYPGLPVRNLKEFVAYAKANPGRINFGTSGPGGSIHLSGLWLAKATQTELAFIHYKGGSQAMTDLIAGRIHVYRQSLGSTLPLIKAGKIRALAMASPERTPLLPEVRTTVEDGYDGYDGSSWLGILAPVRTPEPIVSKLSGELARVARAPDLIKIMDADGAILVGSTPEYFGHYIQNEVSRFAALIKEFDIKPE